MPDIDPPLADDGPDGPGPGLKSLRWLLWLLVVVVLALVAAAKFGGGVGGPASVGPASVEGEQRFGGPFSLTAPDGSAVTDRTLAGEPYAIFFGFTRCPDVCPTSLARMARLRKQLGPQGMKFAIVFVSVDPGHDKPADLGAYVALFGTPILGLTGSDADIARIKRGFGVFSQKVPTGGGDYTIDHTATIFLMTDKGELAGTIDHDESDAAALAKLRRLIG